MKKFVLDGNTTYYLFRDCLSVLKKYDSGRRKFVPLPTEDVNDSELWKNPDVAEWVFEVARKALEIRNEKGEVVGVDGQALSSDDAMLAGIWSKIQAEARDDAEDEPSYLTHDDIEELRRRVTDPSSTLSPEQKQRIMETLEELDE